MLVFAVALAGCGGSDKQTPKEPVQTETGGDFQSAPTGATGATSPNGKAGKGRETTVQLDVPKGWSTPTPHPTDRIWPQPIKALSSFAIAQLPENATCPRAVLDKMPPDGIYVLVSEYTRPRPKGFPPARKLGPRPDLRKLELRPAEVECWDHGLSGQADFAEHGRGFHVEVLLGAKVTPAQRREALSALASLKIS
jgi:hypothetical protein